MDRMLTLAVAVVLVMGCMAAAMADPAASDAAAIPAPNVPLPADPTPAEAAEADPVGTITGLVRDIRAGNWRLAAVAVLVLLMLALSKFRGLVSWFKGDRGGAILVGLLGLLGTLSAALATSEPLGLDLFVGALATTWTAVGGYTWVKRLWKPSDQELKLPLPAE